LQRSLTLLGGGFFLPSISFYVLNLPHNITSVGLQDYNWCEIETKSSEKLLGSPPLQPLASLLVGGYLK
jgi:hypothetical protein